MPNVPAAMPGSRILIVEDEWFLAEYITDAVTGAGGNVLGPVGTVQEALELLERKRPDAATLNVRLGEDRSYPVADKLLQLRVPFVFLSATQSELPVRLLHVPFLQKPFAAYQVVDELERLLMRRSPGPSIRGH